MKTLFGMAALCAVVACSAPVNPGPVGVRPEDERVHPFGTSDLMGQWLIESLAGEPFNVGVRPATVTISTNRISAQGGCNIIDGPFTASGPGRIGITGPLASTLRGCAEADERQDARLMAAIAAANRYQIEGDRLVITGGPGMILRRAPEAGRAP